MKLQKKIIASIVIIAMTLLLIGMNYKVNAAENISVAYRTHVQDDGWQKYVKDGAMAGTSGRSLRLEGINIKLENNILGGSVEYRTHVQDIGWQSYVKDDAMSGTSGQSKRLEAISIKLTGKIAESYDIYYRVHCQDFGWLGWAKNGENAGSAGYSKRLEGVEIRLVKKGETAPGSTDNNFIQNITYQTHVQDYGWQNYVNRGDTAGTSGQSKRLEGIRIRINSCDASGDIEYRTHVQNIGWQSYVKNGDLAGTSGQSLRLEAISIRLTGQKAEQYDIYYRVHAQNFGWMGWAKNGEDAGTTGYAYRLEAIQIVLVGKGEAAPGSIDNHFKVYEKPEVEVKHLSYTSYTSNYLVNYNSSTDLNDAPGLKEQIEALKQAHPNWNFKLLKINRTFSEIVSGECSYHGRNIIERGYDSSFYCEVCGGKTYDTGRWYCASQTAVGYYMDARNFMDDVNIFQFLDVNNFASNYKVEDLSKLTSGTFLSGYEQDIYNACKNKGVDPTYIIARLIQENGSSGSTTSRGMQSDGYTWYNPFNIGATGSGSAQVIANALAKAKEYGWNTMQRALEGGIEFLKANWLENCQNTIYLNKFDIDDTNGTGLYSHQYMGNLLAPYSEGRSVYNYISKLGRVDSNFTFIIPVYKNMGDGIKASTINVKNVKIQDSRTNVRFRSSTNTSSDSNIIQTYATGGQVFLQIKDNVAGSWSMLLREDGVVGYIYTEYLTDVEDVTTCNISAKIKTNEGLGGVRLRCGPGTGYESIKSLDENTELTIIDNTTYATSTFDTSYTWYRVKLQDGTQGFVVNNYLKQQ